MSACKNVRSIRRYLKEDATTTIKHGIVSYRLDHGNAALGSIVYPLINKIQRLQTTCGRIIKQIRRCDHITAVLIKLHWLPVRICTDYGVACVPNDPQVTTNCFRHSLLFAPAANAAAANAAAALAAAAGAADAATSACADVFLLSRSCCAAAALLLPLMCCCATTAAAIVLLLLLCYYWAY